jgi:transposase
MDHSDVKSLASPRPRRGHAGASGPLCIDPVNRRQWSRFPAPGAGAVSEVHRLVGRVSLQRRESTAAAKIAILVDEHGTRLREIDGVGPVLAARLLGRTGSPGRFVSAAAYANYTGTAPVQIASADSSQHRLSRYGDRQLNSAIYTIAMIRIRMPASTGRAYYDKKIAEGKSPRCATRALRRHLAAHLWRMMLADETRTARMPSEVTATAS